MATAQQYLAKAASYIGISGTDNIFNTWYWGRHCYNPDTYPWCACFQSYVGVHDLNMPFKPSASAAGVAWQGTPIADSEVQPGDWVLFTWDGRQDFGWADHIGVVEWSDINNSGYFGTIEGNTGSGQGTVKRQTRYNWGSYGTKFFRPPYKEDKPMPNRDAQLWEVNRSSAQKVKPHKNSDGTYSFEFACKDGYMLDVRDGASKSGTLVQAYPSNGTDAQKWKIERVVTAPDKVTKYDPPEIAPFKIIPACAPELRLSSADNGTKLKIAKAKINNAQRWAIVDNGDGTWTLINVKWQKVVDLKNFGN